MNVSRNGLQRRYQIAGDECNDIINSGRHKLNPSFAYTGISWPMIRYTDVLLMFAEAENEINYISTGAVIGAFKQVRLRGFNGDENK